MSEIPVDTSGRRQAFFEQEGVDQLVSMVLELATDLWVVRERMYILERAAEQHGLPLRSAIESYQLDPTEKAELAAMRQRMLEEMMRTVGRDHRRMSARESV